MNPRTHWITEHLPDWRKAICYADTERGVLVVKLRGLGVTTGGSPFYDRESRRALTAWGYEETASEEGMVSIWTKRLSPLFGDESDFLRLCSRFIGWIWLTKEPRHHYLDRMPIAACRESDGRWRVIVNDRTRVPHGVELPEPEIVEVQELPEDLYGVAA